MQFKRQIFATQTFIKYIIVLIVFAHLLRQLARRVGRSNTTHEKTMDFAASLNSTEEGLFTSGSNTISESHEDASHSSPAGGLWTTETMSTRAPIVTDSLWEQGFIAGLFMLFWLYVNVSNGILFYVFHREYSLHTPQFMVLVSYMVCDTLYCNFTLLLMVPMVISNNIHVMPASLCRILAIAFSSCFLASVHLNALLTYERHCYFVTPLIYTRKFTRFRIFATVITIFLFSFGMGLAVDLIEPRVAVATIMSYQVTGLASQISNVVYVVFYVIPSGLISVITLIKLRLLISKHTAQVHPTQSDVMSEDQSAVSGIIVKPVRKALKMVALVSGSFWLTIMPGVLIRMSLSASGVTWAYTDQRISLPLFALSRTSYMLITVMSSVLNPIIYVSVLTEVRVAVWKCIGIKRNNSVIHNSAS